MRELTREHSTSIQPESYIAAEMQSGMLRLAKQGGTQHADSALDIDQARIVALHRRELGATGSYQPLLRQ
jgi:hypothetical protein